MHLHSPCIVIKRLVIFITQLHKPQAGLSLRAGGPRSHTTTIIVLFNVLSLPRVKYSTKYGLNSFSYNLTFTAYCLPLTFEDNYAAKHWNAF